MRRLLVGAAALCLFTAEAPAPEAVVAQSGTTTVTTGEIRKLFDQADPGVRDQLRRDPASLAQLVRSELLRKQLLDEARAKKWDQMPDVAARAQQARDAVVTNSYINSLTEPPADYPAEADIQAAYDANKPRFMVPRQFHLEQVFVNVANGAPKSADDEAQKKLRDLRAQLAKPKADFADAARKTSEDASTAGKGGDLGWLREDQLVPVVKDAVAGLSDNQLSEPVRAADGWHLLKLLGTRPAAVAPLAEVRDTIVRALRQQKQSANERALAEDMQKRQPVRIDEIQLAKAIPP